MDGGDGSDFSFSSVSEYLKGQDADDMSWADIFLDGIHSDDAIIQDPGAFCAGTSNSGSGIHGAAQHQVQQDLMGGQLQIHIPGHFQGSVTSNAVRSAEANLCGTVTYLAPSTSTHPHVGAGAGGIHGVMTMGGHNTTAAGQQQANTKLFHISAPSFPMSQLPNSVPLQTILQSNQSLGGQTIYSNQNAGMFPAQGSVHIENPKVVNVNFGPHVIGSDGSGHQTIFQTAEGKRVVITNSQLQQVPQYQSGHGSQLIHTQPTLISGPGLQVVNTGGGQGNQVQFIAQSSINQAGIGQQQGTVMNLLNNSGASNHITGLMPGQNIFVNGQVLNIGQLRSLAMPQLHVQNSAGLTLTDMNAAVTSTAQFQAPTPHLVIQHNGQQQQILLQTKSHPSPTIITNSAQSQRFNSNLLGYKNTRTPTPNASSASSTPVLTPAPSTPTPTATPELLSDFAGDKGNQGINILKQALDMSNIDLQSFEDNISFLDSSTDSYSVMSSQPSAHPQKTATKFSSSKSKLSKHKLTNFQQIAPSDNNLAFQPTIAQFENIHEQNFNPGMQQKFVTANGQTYVLSSNNVILQSSINSANPSQHQLMASSEVDNLHREHVNMSTGYHHMDIKGFGHNNVKTSNLDRQLKPRPHSISVSSHDRNVFITADADRNVLIKTCPDEAGSFQIETTSGFPNAQIAYTSASGYNASPVSVSSNLLDFNHIHVQQMRNQNTGTSGLFIQQTPSMSVIKQETVSDWDQSHYSGQASSYGTTTTDGIHNMATPMSGFGAVTSPVLISTALFTAVTTATTQSHQTTIMSTTPLSTTNLQHSSSISDTSTNTVYKPIEMPSPSTSFLGFHSKSARQIADSTLMLNLTPGQKERLENQLARISKKDQEGFLLHQQNIIQRSLQQKHLTRQDPYLHPQDQQPQEFVQETIDHDDISQFQQKQFQQSPQYQTYQPLQHRSQSSQQDYHQSSQHRSQHQLDNYYSSSNKYIHESFSTEMTTPQPVIGLPTTVQELTERLEEKDLHNYQHLSSHSEQSQYTTAVKMSKQQHQMFPNHEQRIKSHSTGAAPVQPSATPQIERSLAEQQLLRDRSLALDPDVSTPFRSLSDAMRRLVRYHTMQDHKPEENSKALRIWDSRYSKLCDYLIKKKRCFIRRFNKIQLYNDMCEHKLPGYIENLACFNEQLKLLTEREQERARKQRDYTGSFVSGFVRIDKTLSGRTATIASDQHLHNFYVKDYCVHKYVFPRTAASEKYEYSRKRSASETGISSGMLKMVFKRKANDNCLFVRNSLDSADKLPRHLRPVVNLEKSDSEYEFDTSTADITCNQPIKVRRKLSHQNSVDVKCDTSSESDDETCDDSTYEEEEDSCDTDEEEDDDDDGFVKRKIYCNRSNERDFVKSNMQSVTDDVDDSSDCYAESVNSSSSSSNLDSDDTNVSGNDAFLQDEKIISKACDNFCEVGTSTSSSVYPLSLTANEKSCDIQNLNSEDCMSIHHDHNDSISSNNLFNSSLSYSHLQPLPIDDRVSHYSSCSVSQELDQQRFSLKTQTNDSSSISQELDQQRFSFKTQTNDSSSVSQELDQQRFFFQTQTNESCSVSQELDQQRFSFKTETNNSCSVSQELDRQRFSFKTESDNNVGNFCDTSQLAEHNQEIEYVPDSSPIHDLEEEASRKGLLNCSLFTTPNKSLLKTDAMFNSEDEDSDVKIVSTFNIDKDPQSSMIDDSVRSVINSVLNSDGGDDDKSSSRTSWVTASPGHMNLFQPYTSITVQSGPNEDLDLSAPTMPSS